MHSSKLLSVFVLISVGLFFLCPTAPEAQTRGLQVVVKDHAGKELSLYHGSYALLIGVSQYTHGWPKLEAIPGEMKKLNAALVANGFKVETVMDPDSTKLQNAFSNFIDHYGYDPNNRLLFFYSGHGYSNKSKTKGYLVPADAPDPREDWRGFLRKALNMSYILADCKAMEAKHSLFLFDSCFSGTIFKTRAMPEHPPYISSITASPVRQFISAGSAGEEVPAISVFVPSFIRALRGEGDVDGDGYMTGTELGMYLHKKVLSYETGQTPQYGKIRDPNLDEGDFVFMLASSGATIEKPPKPKAKKTYLSVEGTVAGATVFVNGSKAGKTPLNKFSIKSGQHKVRVEKAGYEPYRKTIRVKSGRDISVWVDLTKKAPPKGQLHVDTDPPDARIRILNIGPAFTQGIELEAGRYLVEVSADDYEARRLWVSLGAGEDKRVTVRLEPVPKVEVPVAEPIINSIGMEFVYINPGSFMMGSPDSEQGRQDDEYQHLVELTREFYLQATEVTVGQWRSFAEGREYETEAERQGWAWIWDGRRWGKKYGYYWDRPGFDQNDDQPVTCVSWNDAQKFIEWLNQSDDQGAYRLPTEAEWEYAARAGSETAFANGDISEPKCGFDANLNLMGWYCGNADSKSYSVGLKQANEWGLYDMHGNVWEWCQDWYANEYPTDSAADPKGPSSGPGRVVRGGGWDYTARRCRSAFRSREWPSDRFNYLGFRVALSPIDDPAD